MPRSFPRKSGATADVSTIAPPTNVPGTMTRMSEKPQQPEQSERPNPRVLGHMNKAEVNHHLDFIANHLSIKAQVPSLKLCNNGDLICGTIHDQGYVKPQVPPRKKPPCTLVGSDSVPTRDDKFSMLSGIAHDPIQRDIFTPLFLGAQLIVPHRDAIILVGSATAQFPTLRRAFFVHDRLTKKDCTKLQDLAPNAHIINMYGTTETQRAGMLDVQLLVVNREDRNICDNGQQGELFLKTGDLAEGYLGEDANAANLKDSKFLANWFVDFTGWVKEYEQATSVARQPWMAFSKGPRDHLYKVGDLGNFLPDGLVECTVCTDNQVKIRGFRIEPGEIGTHSPHHPFIREYITIIRRNKDQEPLLVSYIVPETKRRSQAMVPNYTIPSMFIPLARIPLNLNGKVDKPSLSFPNAIDLDFQSRWASEVSSSMTDNQRKVAIIWGEVLPDRSARMFLPEPNFFEEGGHSILAQRMLSKVKRVCQYIDVPMSSDEAYAVDALDLVQQLSDSIPRTYPDHPYALHRHCNWCHMIPWPYALCELLKRKIRVIVHVQSEDSVTGLARIGTITKAYGLWSEDWRSQLEEYIANEANTIIQNGSHEDWMLPYSSLRAANKPKKLAFVSSTSTLNSEHYIQLSQGSIAAGGTGVLEWKCASEYIVRESGRRGVIGTIIHPGYITGDPESGISITGDFLIQARPDITNTVNLVPVTQVSRIVIAAALHPPVDSLGVVRVYGYSVPKISYEEWWSRLRGYMSDEGREEHALPPLFHFVTSNPSDNTIAPDSTIPVPRRSLYTYRRPYPGQNPLACYFVRLETIGMYLAYLVAVGFPPPPSMKGERKLGNCELRNQRIEALASRRGRAARP
ncbi:acetyl-CoA synthetase-like protein [Zopfia rhizophila CBS 207.26]|uniref:Acetyl-CoA synthetase-like protein n=1 Tax=Zopfia rhizophila CBS 207.26 TaxID=1314779 RepID=A0A6A6E497_9PEZI|nr:acetyl-CoA synthetase-like protein [Zopfia rhizophila CBS 207.26]